MNLSKTIVIILLFVSVGLFATGKVKWSKSEKPLIRNTPQGMCYVGSGRIKSIQKGDSAKAEKNDTTIIRNRPFYMQETEVTNAKYKEFVFWVKDSILRERFSKCDPTYKKINSKGDSVLNWKKALPDPTKKSWAKVIYNEVFSIDPLNGKKVWDVSNFNYRYRYHDKQSLLKWETAKQQYDKSPAYDTLRIDSFFIDKSGKICTLPLVRHVKSVADFFYDKIVNVYPDTTVWLNKEFVVDNNKMYVAMYFASPAYQKYPVVGVTGPQIEGYCNWLNTIKEIKNEKGFGEYRLPTETEWDFAARKGFDDYESQDLSAFIKKNGYQKGCSIANLKSKKGDFSNDGYLLTAPVGYFYPNYLGLFDMIGNVDEWTEKPFFVKNNTQTNDSSEEKYRIVKGGSFHDTYDFDRRIRIAYSFDKPYCFVGFRLVRSCTK